MKTAKNPHGFRIARHAPILALVAMLLAWWCAVFNYASMLSAATDEIPHLGDGLSILALRDYRLNPEHPPLVKVLGCLPAHLFLKPRMNLDGFGGIDGPKSPFTWADQGTFGFAILYLDNFAEARRLLLVSRQATILFGILGAILAYLWGSTLSGSAWGGLFASVLLLTYPEYAGNSALLTMDVPLLAACGAISWFAWVYIRRPCPANAVLLSVISAVCCLVKLPATVFLVLTLLVIFCLAFFLRKRLRPVRLAILLALLVSFWVAGAWTAAGFRFAYTNPNLPIAGRNEYVPPQAGDHLTLIQSATNFAWRHRLLPEASLATFNHTTTFKERRYFFRGIESSKGSLLYFPTSILMKTPIPLILLMMLIPFGRFLPAKVRKAETCGGHARRAPFTCHALLIVPFAILFLLVCLSRYNLGHRYVLFAYFPVCVMGGVLLHRLHASGGIRRLGAITLILLQFMDFAANHQSWSLYFNVLGGSSYKASRSIQGSSTDYGQDLWRLENWSEAHGHGPLNLGIYGLNLPDAYGVDKYIWINNRDGFPFHERFKGSPDPTIPSIISVNRLARVREDYPQLYSREPDFVDGPFVIYLPGPP